MNSGGNGGAATLSCPSKPCSRGAFIFISVCSTTAGFHDRFRIHQGRVAFTGIHRTPAHAGDRAMDVCTKRRSHAPRGGVCPKWGVCAGSQGELGEFEEGGMGCAPKHDGTRERSVPDEEDCMDRASRVRGTESTRKGRGDEAQGSSRRVIPLVSVVLKDPCPTEWHCPRQSGPGANWDGTEVPSGASFGLRRSESRIWVPPRHSACKLCVTAVTPRGEGPV